MPYPAWGKIFPESKSKVTYPTMVLKDIAKWFFHIHKRHPIFCNISWTWNLLVHLNNSLIPHKLRSEIHKDSDSLSPLTTQMNFGENCWRINKRNNWINVWWEQLAWWVRNRHLVTYFRMIQVIFSETISRWLGKYLSRNSWNNFALFVRLLLRETRICINKLNTCGNEFGRGIFSAR